MAKVKWVRNKSIEKRAADQGLEMSWEKIDFNKIDHRQSRMSQNRLETGSNGKLFDEHVEGLALKMCDGYEMDGVVFQRQKSGKLVTLDGNHRISAFMMLGLNTEQPEINAYVIQGGPVDKVDLFTRSSNADKMSQTLQEKYKQIDEHLRRCTGEHNNHEIAIQFSVGVDVVESRRRLLEEELKFKELGLLNLSISHRANLRRLMPNEEMIVAAGNLIEVKKLTAEETKTLVDKLRTSDKWKDVIKGYSSRPRSRRGLTQPVRKLGNALDAAENVLDSHGTVAKLGAPPHVVAQVSDKLIRLNQKWGAITNEKPN